MLDDTFINFVIYQRFGVESTLPTPIPFTKKYSWWYRDVSDAMVLWTMYWIIVIYDVDFYMVQYFKNTMLLPWHIQINKTLKKKRNTNFLYYLYTFSVCLWGWHIIKPHQYCWFSILLVCHISTPTSAFQMA